MTSYSHYILFLKTFFVNYKIFNSNYDKVKNKAQIYPYLEKINNIRAKKKNFFEFEIKDIINKEFPKELRWLFMYNTKRFLKLVKITIFQLISELSSNQFFFKNKNFFEKLYNQKTKSSKNLFDFFQFQIVLKPGKTHFYDKFETIGGNLVGKYIFLRAKITEISPFKIAILRAVYSCSSCGFEFVRDIRKENFKPFFRCPSKICRYSKISTNLFLNTSLTIFENIQEIKVCDSFLDGFSENFDQNLKIKICGNHMNKMEKGEMIRVAGVLIPISLKNEKYQNFIQNLILEASFVEKIKIFPYYKATKKEHEKNILKLFFKKNIFLKLSESFAPEVFGNTEIKKTLLLFASGQFSNKIKNTSFFKDNFNILILGESGSAKTKLLKFFSNLKINSTYTNRMDDITNFLFSANLFDESNVKIKKNQISENQISKIFCLDNLNYLSIENCLLLRKILAKYFYPGESIGKKSNNYIFSLVSAATLEREIFEKSFPIYDQHFFFHLFPEFDLTFLIPGVSNFNSDKNMANHVILNYKKNNSNLKDRKFIKASILRSYILEAQKVFPSIDDGIFDFILYYYVSCRIDNKEILENNINIKSISLLFHMSLSLTRLKFQKSVSRMEVKESIRLFEFSKKSCRKIQSFQGSNQNQDLDEKIYKNIRDFSLYSKNCELNLSILENFLVKKGFRREDFINCLGHYEDLNVWKISITKSKLIFLF